MGRVRERMMGCFCEGDLRRKRMISDWGYVYPRGFDSMGCERKNEWHGKRRRRRDVYDEFWTGM
jgi:hypothetical protein